MPETWWKGSRGEWYVVVQVVLFVLVALGPRTWRGWPAWPFPGGPLQTVGGSALLVAGFYLALAGIAAVGSRLTPLPHPVPGAPFRQNGIYAVVRHPMYCGATLAALGWALVNRSWITLGLAILLFALFDLKIRREEARLIVEWPDYASYRKRVRKLIPFVY
jgi:protein-S-isoprenylcysteine O-methyltransferase Ste14